MPTRKGTTIGLFRKNVEAIEEDVEDSEEDSPSVTRVVRKIKTKVQAVDSMS